jgi:hypothetical protein
MNIIERYIKISTCGHCGSQGVYPKRRRMSTAYQDEKSNYIEECDDCFEITEEYWEERWAEYYSMTR